MATEERVHRPPVLSVQQPVDEHVRPVDGPLPRRHPRPQSALPHVRDVGGFRGRADRPRVDVEQRAGGRPHVQRDAEGAREAEIAEIRVVGDDEVELRLPQRPQLLESLQNGCKKGSEQKNGHSPPHTPAIAANSARRRHTDGRKGANVSA